MFLRRFNEILSCWRWRRSLSSRLTNRRCFLCCHLVWQTRKWLSNSRRLFVICNLIDRRRQYRMQSRALFSCITQEKKREIAIWRSTKCAWRFQHFIYLDNSISFVRNCKRKWKFKKKHKLQKEIEIETIGKYQFAVRRKSKNTICNLMEFEQHLSCNRSEKKTIERIWRKEIIVYWKHAAAPKQFKTKRFSRANR